MPTVVQKNSHAPTLCRDCGWASASAAPSPSRCPQCQSRRLLSHAELFDLSIAHIDCDAFYAAVEKRDNPELRDQPVIIGGGRRGVVSTACYIARIHGVHSAMPMFKALKACPDAVVVKPDMAKYVAVGKEIRKRMRALTPLVEPLSIDEAFLDLSGTERVHRALPAVTLARLAREIETDVGISISIGLAPNKFLAKIASDQDKPRGFFIVGQAEMVDFLASLPVSKIWGVGKAMQARLKKDGIAMISDLQRADRDKLFRRYGSTGHRLFDLSLGKDARTVSPSRGAKSVSSETTFNKDIDDLETLNRHLWTLSEAVSRRMKASGLSGRTITLKLKTADFKSRTRRITLDEPTQIADRIHRTGKLLLERETDGTRYRLIGIGASDLSEGEGAEADDLFDQAAIRRASAERAADKLRARFGRASVQMGLGFKPVDPAEKPAPPEPEDPSIADGGLEELD